MIPTRPVLRYHGGKWRLAPWIISHFPEHRVYVEPFGGAGSVLMRKPRAYLEVYNDLDQEIVNLFEVLRDPVRAAALERAVRLTPFARREFTDSYLPSGESIEQARRTLVRSFMGFGSASASGVKTGFRSNSNRSNTTPAHDWGNFPSALASFCDRLRGVVVECRPAVEVIRQHDGPETLHYVDPPYPISTRKIGNPYCKKGYRFELTDEDHRELADTLQSIRGMVVLSGYPCDLYDRELFPRWRRVTRKALADGARERTEVLWLNGAAGSRLEDGNLLLGGVA